MRQKIPARADSAGPRNRRSAEPTKPKPASTVEQGAVHEKLDWGTGQTGDEATRR